MLIGHNTRTNIRMADSRSPAPRRSYGEGAINVALAGRIAAGTPIEAAIEVACRPR